MGKLSKRVAIARSGVYQYSAEVLPGLGLSAPPEKKNSGSFGVYRPATVLAKAKDKFVRLPVTLEHPSEMVNGNNFRQLAQGFTGDTASIEYLKDINEVTINSTITLMDNEAVNAYYRGIVEVSPGYIGVFDWEDGVSPNGEKYEIIMRDVKEVNHLALTRAGRGGKAACILDSREVSMKKRNSGLFYSVYKMLGGVKDSGEGSFTEKMSAIISDRLKITPEELEKRVGELRLIVDYLPDSDDKLKLSRYVDDLGRINEENDECANVIGNMIGNLFYTLDTAAMKDAPVTADAAEKPHESTPEEEKKETPEHEASETPEEEKAEHAVGEEGEKPSEGAPDGKGEFPAPDDKGEPIKEEIPQEDLAVGLDDSIFDKPEADLTPEESVYIHTKLMEMLKEHLQSKIVPPTVPTGEPVEAEESAVEEKSESPKEEATENPKEESEEKMKPKEKESADIKDSVETQYPTDVLTVDAIEAVKDDGIDIDTFFKAKMKGGK